MMVSISVYPGEEHIMFNGVIGYSYLYDSKSLNNDAITQASILFAFIFRCRQALPFNNRKAFAGSLILGS